MRYVRIVTKRLEHCSTDDGAPYYYDPDTGTSTYTYPTVLNYWSLLRKLGVVTGNGTVTGAGIELAGRSRRPQDFAGYLTDIATSAEDPEHWELVDGNPPYYYNVYTGESTYTKCVNMRVVRVSSQ